MLVESKRVRQFLNSTVTASAHQPMDLQIHHTDDAHEEPGTWVPPNTSNTPLNPMPALTILLLGLIMSAHVQHSQFASTIHSYWGALFAAASLSRIGTYTLHYLKPPTSYLPSRPPTELVGGFCLVAGGFLFMISARDITDAMEGAGADGMVVFTVGMGFTAVVCAWVVLLMGIKGWAVSRQRSQNPAPLMPQISRV